MFFITILKHIWGFLKKVEKHWKTEEPKNMHLFYAETAGH